ncbi:MULTISPECIES: HAD family hydrolase [Lactobacillales]|uniref:HAD-IA family hydrolase n=1 Tax=Aerococcus urinaeequi TaxID=51665 RepID=A0ABR5ZYA8_9LACT|nr:MULTISPECIES: HAD-IA family hydrolase [Lactobacillales]KAF3306488.1 HAD-IA family hydrolase [Carnobacterium sp. PL17GRE32]MBA5746724.1 HAD-IA family hydrolase [Aerococcus urinaeequi]MBA5829481.1 HAD-IA family hydrolase [Aerococcus urinaeequi]MBA5860412.1 HAD-IA family hydrolase [Aerococcus urinaeequi]HCT98281.1 haloacid dehalogenase [Aerococcus urinaeequi]
MYSLKNIFFDMDGVITDSEYTYLNSKTEILKEAGFDKDISYQYQFMGTTYEYMWQTMKDELGLPLSIDKYIKLMNHKRKLMIQNDGVKAILGAQDFIKKLSDAGFQMAVASSSPKKDINHVMSSLDLNDHFKYLVSGEEVENSKPAPDVFLLAADLLNSKPEDCVVIEDTKNGVLAGKAAGMYTIGFNNPDYPDQDLSAADQIVTSFKQIPIDQFR